MGFLVDPATEKKLAAITRGCVEAEGGPWTSFSVISRYCYGYSTCVANGLSEGVYRFLDAVKSCDPLFPAAPVDYREQSVRDEADNLFLVALRGDQEGEGRFS